MKDKVKYQARVLPRASATTSSTISVQYHKRKLIPVQTLISINQCKKTSTSCMVNKQRSFLSRHRTRVRMKISFERVEIAKEGGQYKWKKY